MKKKTNKYYVNSDGENILISSVTEDVEDSLEEQKPKQYRDFIILLYEDTSSYDFKEVLSIIKSQKYYAYIKHTPESDEKKIHFHVRLHFENGKRVSTLSNQLGVPEQFVQPVKSVRRMDRYLIHKDDDDKIQYSIDQVIISDCFKRKYLKSFDDLKDENQIIDDIYIFIDNLKFLNFNECLRALILYVNSQNYDTIYKRYRPEFIEYLKSQLN